MTNHKNTKKALFGSVISMILCFAMLIGSTFAWFTDNASTAVNSIEAGTLNIELLDGNDGNANSLEGKTLTFAKAAAAPEGEKVLFEPGARYELDQVWLHNAGDLYAKYQVIITGIDGSSKLAEALDVYVGGSNVGTLAELIISGGIINSSVIAPDKYYTFGSIELEMKNSAGNEYQGLTMEGIAITVQATQAAVEYDSEDNQYDTAAEYDEFVNIHSQDELNKAIANANGALTLILDDGAYTLPDTSSAQAPNGKTITISGSKNTVINMPIAVAASDCSMLFDGVTVVFPNGVNYVGLQHTKKVVYKDCVIKGQQTMYAPEVAFVDCTLENKNNAYCVWTYGATNANFINCTFNTAGKAVLVYTEGETHAVIGLDDCVFNDDNTVATKKGAVEIGSSAHSDKTTYDIYINDCTVNGFAVNDEGISTGSTFWGNKNSMDTDHLNVVIDGVEVY